jgi:hypothetical protein
MTSDEQDRALGPHPVDVPWDRFVAQDGATDRGVPHRALSLNGQRDADVVPPLRDMLARHHVTPEALQRD